MPTQWKEASNVLAHEKGSNDDPSSFRPITFKSIITDEYTTGFNLQMMLQLSRRLSQKSLLLLNCLTKWCQWSMIKIRVDECVAFGLKKLSTRSMQFQRELFKK